MLFPYLELLVTNRTGQLVALCGILDGGGNDGVGAGNGGNGTAVISQGEGIAGTIFI